jgi:peptidoglycan L-alanyl-D-glutamate endopeptidase CwlK
MAGKYHTRNMNNINKLGDNTKVMAKELLSYCEKNGIEILIYSTIRTVAEQKANVASGASQTMKSYHIVGQALDWVMVDSKGNTLWNGYTSAAAKKVIAKAKSLGFTWGGDWKSFKDSPHFQYEYKGYGTDTFGKKATVSVAKPKPKPVPKPASIKTVGKVKIVGVKYAAYIMAKPGGKNISTAKVGSTLPIAGSIKGYYEVIYKGERAYVASKYCKLV